MKAIKGVLGVAMVILLIVGLSSVFTITQGEHGILLRLGRLVQDSSTDKTKILSPGLHFKMPFIENVRVFDTRLQTLDIKSSRIVTKEKKDVIADYYVKWRISDLEQYFKATGGNEMKAEKLLEQQLNTLLRNEFGKRTIPDVVSDARDDIMSVLLQGAEKQAAQLGIHVVDVRIKGIELPSSTSNAIYQRMRADMRKIANRHRADGRAEAEAIQASADRKVTVILADAQSRGKIIRGEGQGQAAKIYAKAYGKDKKFFEFYRSLSAYVDSFNKPQDLLILDQSSSFFDYFKHSLTKKTGSS